MTLLASLFAPLPAAAGSAEGAVCLRPGPSGAGLETGAVRAALVVEARKLSRPLTVTIARSGERCPDSPRPAITVDLGPGARARLNDGGETSDSLDLSEVLPVERAGVVARTTLALLDDVSAGETAPTLVDLTAPVPLPPPTGAPDEAESPPPRVALRLGGGYLRQLGPGRDRGTLDAAAEVALWDGRLAAGLAGSWLPATAGAGGDPSAELSGGELLAFVRGGFPWGPLLVRAGLGAGWQWRHLALSSAHRFDTPNADGGAGVLGIDAELVWRFAPPFTAHLVVPGRMYLGGVRHRWNGRSLEDAPRGAVGVGLYLGVEL